VIGICFKFVFCDWNFLWEALMLLKHAGLACSTEDKADKFYRDLLGLKKSESKYLSADLSKAIFDLDSELQMINYRACA